MSGDLVPVLRRVPALADLPDDVLEQVGRDVEDRGYGPGETVVAEGDPGDELFVVAEGRAEVTARSPDGSTTLGTLAPGEMFGEIAVLDPAHVRTATVIATTPLRLLALSRAAFEELTRRFPSVGAAVAADAETLRIRQFLKQASPFAAIEGGHLRRLASRLVRTSVAAGEEFIREGEPGDRCYLVCSGEVEVLRQRGGTTSHVATIGPGSVVGETALLTGAPRTATVRATSATELFALSRADLMEAIGEDPEVGIQLLDIVRLRERPRRAEGTVAEHSTTADGEVITVLKDPARGAYFRLSPQGWFIWQRLDGENGLRELTLAYLVEFKAFAPGPIAEIVAGLARAGFAHARAIRPDVVAALTRSSPWRRVLLGAGRLVDVRASFPADRLVQVLFGRGGFLLYQPAALALMAVVALAGLAAFLAPGRPAAAAGAALLWVTLASYAVTVLCHELAHALTTKWIGRDVGRAGVGWYWFAPFAYVDTSDVWVARKWQRIAVTVAGPCANLVVGGVMSLGAWFATDPLLSALLWQAALVPYLGTVLNLNPFLEYDGYFVLSDLLERPNLRRHAFEWLGQDLPRLIRERVLPRGRVLELAYGLASLLYVVAMAGVTLLVYRAVVQEWLARLVPSAAAAGLAFVLVGAVVVAACGAVAGDLRRRHQAV